MELNFSSAILFLTGLFIFILYLGMNRESAQKRVLSVTIAVYAALLIGWLTLAILFRLTPERVAGFIPSLAALGELYRLLMALGWIVLAVIFLRAFPPEVPSGLAGTAALAISFALVLLGGNCIFSMITGG